MKHLLILSLTLLFSIPFGAQAQWFTDYNAALKKAQAENKSVLINFTGSDWCPPCMRLKAEVFDKYEFKKYAHDNLILLEIDFPRRIDQPPGVRAANQKLSKQFGVTGYPSVFLVDNGGNQLLKTGYTPGGPKAFLARLQNTSPAETARPTPQPAAKPSAPKKQETPAYAVAPVVIRYDNLALKGISGGRTKMALINNQSLAAGEKGKVKVGDKSLDVLVTEIRETSVLIQIEGEPEPRELVMKAGVDLSKE
ncbi:MAG: thioredoxin family protein [Verrucomicrobia bacterium]|nr:thioredoxin family protein [Verrucomicrobiota bacterium]